MVDESGYAYRMFKNFIGCYNQIKKYILFKAAAIT